MDKKKLIEDIARGQGKISPSEFEELKSKYPYFKLLDHIYANQLQTTVEVSQQQNIENAEEMEGNSQNFPSQPKTNVIESKNMEDISEMNNSDSTKGNSKTSPKSSINLSHIYPLDANKVPSSKTSIADVYGDHNSSTSEPPASVSQDQVLSKTNLHEDIEDYGGDIHQIVYGSKQDKELRKSDELNPENLESEYKFLDQSKPTAPSIIDHIYGTNNQASAKVNTTSDSQQKSSVNPHSLYSNIGKKNASEDQNIPNPNTATNSLMDETRLADKRVDEDIHFSKDSKESFSPSDEKAQESSTTLENNKYENPEFPNYVGETSEKPESTNPLLDETRLADKTVDEDIHFSKDSEGNSSPGDEKAQDSSTTLENNKYKDPEFPNYVGERPENRDEISPTSNTDSGQQIPDEDDYGNESLTAPDKELSVDAKSTEQSTNPHQSDSIDYKDEIESGEARYLTKHLSFMGWLDMLRRRSEDKKKEEEKIIRIKAQWQKAKLESVLEEEVEPIDDNVFEMVINSVKEDEDLISEPLAELYEKQGHKQKAIQIYQKLILKYPEKSSYFDTLIRKLSQ